MVTFNVSFDYLVAIFPSDSKCPILRTEMEWLGHSKNSPSLDRIIPELGYLEGNVAWVSNHANVMKLNRTSEILRMMAGWIETETLKASTNEKN